MTKGENRISSYTGNGYEQSPDADDAPNDLDGFENNEFSNTVDSQTIQNS